LQEANFERGHLQESGESAKRFLHSYFNFCMKSCGFSPSKCFLVIRQVLQN